jgi:SAM-dependent methyltransferase
VQTVGVSLREAWDSNAESWVAWVRKPGHDSYDQFHRRRFLQLVPPPGRLTIDLGAGEGRLGRDLTALGHRVVALDASVTLARACRSHARPLPFVVGDAAAPPLRAGCADLIVAFMSLHDVDDLSAAVTEIGRLLAAGGCLCMTIVHPLNSAGRFEGDREDHRAPFVIRGSYLEAFRYHDEVERDGLLMSFHSEHRPLETYCLALEKAGLVIEAAREVTVDDPEDRWARIPMFLNLRARRTQGSAMAGQERESVRRL